MKTNKSNGKDRHTDTALVIGEDLQKQRQRQTQTITMITTTPPKHASRNKQRISSFVFPSMTQTAGLGGEGVGTRKSGLCHWFTNPVRRRFGSVKDNRGKVSVVPCHVTSCYAMSWSWSVVNGQFYGSHALQSIRSLLLHHMGAQDLVGRSVGRPVL